MSSSGSVLLPLFIPADVRPGEGLMSMMVRTAEKNVLGRLHRMAHFAELSDSRVDSIPFTRWNDATALASVLSVGVDHVRERMHPPVLHSSADDYVDWYGTPLHRRYIETRQRRFSLASLSALGHDLAIWSLKPLLFCPDSLELLVDRCGECDRPISWATMSSLSFCDGCKRPMMSDLGETVPVELGADARLAARMVDPDPTVRRGALDELPLPFRSWEAGDVFQAVVELGLVARSPIAPDGCKRWKSMSRGNFEAYSTDDLVAGVHFVRHWPDSLKEHLKEITENRSGPIRILMGRLGKYFDKACSQTPIQRLVQQTVPDVMRQLPIPLRSNQFQTENVQRSADQVTATEAAAHVLSDKKMVARLAGSRRCCIAKKAGASLYRRSAVEQAFQAWRASIAFRQVAAVLGLQTYCVQSLLDAGLIEAPANVDAALLAQEALITKESADRFMLRFARVPLSGGGSQIVSFREAMRDVLAPDLWVQGFEGLLSGALRLAKYAETDACLADRLYVYDDDFEHLRISDDRRDPPDLSVSASEAAELLNVSNTLVSGAVKIGLIQGMPTKTSVQVPLSEVRRYRRDFIGAQEVKRKAGLSAQRFSALMKARGFKPAGDVYNTLFWRRADAELALLSQCS